MIKWTTASDPITLAVFYDVLEQWLEHTHEGTIGGGEGDHQGRAAWIWVAIGDHRCHLNADTTRQGVRELLQRRRAANGALAWHVSANQNGTCNKITFGEGRTPIAGFYLYLRPPASEPFRLL